MCRTRPCARLLSAQGYRWCVRADGGWGLYNDQTTSHVTHTNNIVYGTLDAAYHDHEGFDGETATTTFSVREYC